VASFAAFLVGRDYLTASELEEVTQAVVLYGGRLGTAVVEAGLMTPDELDHALAQHLELPEIPKEWLRKPDPGARAALHPDLVKRHRAFPLHFEKRTLHVGLVDPRDSAVLDALAFASGCLIAPYPLSELRFAALMRRVYGVEPSPRFAALLDVGQLARAQRQRAAQRDSRRRAQEEAPRELVLGPLAADLDLVDEATFVATSELRPAPPRGAAAEEPWELPQDTDLQQASEPPRRPAPAHAAATAAAELRRAEQALASAGRRDELIDAALALASRFAELAALFVVRDGMAAGLRALRAGEPLEVESIVAPLAGEGLLCEVARTGQPAQRAPASALDKLVAKALRCEAGAELAAFPITIGGRVVNVLVAHAVTGALPVTAAAALRALAQLLGASYERMIRSFKQQSRPEA
jgi:hypothetical protein